MGDNTNILGYIESRIINLQAQINNLQELVNHYRAVLNDYKRLNRIDMPIEEFQNSIPKEETISL
jgi:hypothetical protein